jgi:hypothetical protein
MPHGKQVSPDKNVNFPCVGKRGTRLRHASFTVSPVPRASTCCAALPRDSALYDVSVRQLASLHSGFLQTPPHGSALEVCAYLPSISNFVTFHNVTWNTYRGLEPHEFTRMPGVHNALQGTGYHCGFPKFRLPKSLSWFIQVGCCKIASP